MKPKLQCQAKTAKNILINRKSTNEKNHDFHPDLHREVKFVDDALEVVLPDFVTS